MLQSRLNSRPVVWRQQGEIQIGAGSAPVLLTGLTDAETDAVLDMTGGKHHTNAELAKGGISPTRIRELRQRLATAARPAEPLPTLPYRPVPLDGGTLTRLTVEALEPLGGGAPTRGRPTIAVLTSWYVTDPLRVRPLLRNDTPFLPLTIDDDGITVGPICFPGITACPSCLDRARTEADPRYPTVATQLRLMPPGTLDQIAARFAVAAAVLLLGPSSARGIGWRIERGGIAQFTLLPHLGCGCTQPGAGRPTQPELLPAS